MDQQESNSLPTSAARRRFLKNAVLAASSASVVDALAGPAANADLAGAPVRGCVGLETPMRDVEGKVAFITGGSSGIGLGIARAFADAGMKVALGYRTESHLQEAMKHLASAEDRVHAIRIDVTDRPGMEKAAAETARVFGKVHVLVNNAGVALPPSLSATSYQDWDWLLGVNLNGPFNGVRTFLPLIQSHGEGGQVVTTSSAMGLFAMSAGAAYTVSKFAVVGMMEALRAELAGTKIGVSIFCPGMVDSNIEESSFSSRPVDSTVKDDPELIDRLRKIRRDRELAMDPLEVGRLVLRGIRNDDLYIFTHPEFEQIMRDRSEALIASIPRDLHPPKRRVEGIRSAFRTSIYTVERDRKLCAKKESGKDK